MPCTSSTRTHFRSLWHDTHQKRNLVLNFFLLLYTIFSTGLLSFFLRFSIVATRDKSLPAAAPPPLSPDKYCCFFLDAAVPGSRLTGSLFFSLSLDPSIDRSIDFIPEIISRYIWGSWVSRMIIFHLKCYILIDENQSIDRYYITLYIRFNFENNHFSSQIETMLLYFNRQLTKISLLIDRSIDFI